ncbi:rhodanese-like domain-containing protein [Myxococcota bacterium]|nr:rhodanese-like domain-containing protein [Myxococcota bacterium]
MSFFTNLFGAANNGLVNGPQARLAVQNGAILLDVRTPMEHEAGAIPGSKNIAVQELVARIGELDPTKSYVVYCRSGGRSAAATALLRQHGFQNVADLGGVGNW